VGRRVTILQQRSALRTADQACFVSSFFQFVAAAGSPRPPEARNQSGVVFAQRSQISAASVGAIETLYERSPSPSIDHQR